MKKIVWDVPSCSPYENWNRPHPLSVLQVFIFNHARLQSQHLLPK